MACRLNSTRIVGNKPTDMTAFTSTANAWMYSSQKCSRGKTATIRVIVTRAAFNLCRDVINFLRQGNTRVVT